MAEVTLGVEDESSCDVDDGLDLARHHLRVRPLGSDDDVEARRTPQSGQTRNRAERFLTERLRGAISQFTDDE